jgi:hypothetical protein
MLSRDRAPASVTAFQRYAVIAILLLVALSAVRFASWRLGIHYPDAWPHFDLFTSAQGDLCLNEGSAQSFFVKPASDGGSDSANGQTLATAWATVQKATATLTAGQEACVRGQTTGGAQVTYTASTAIQFANSGTGPSNRIKLRGYPGDPRPIIDRQGTANGTDTNCSNLLCAAFAIANRDYITLQRLDIRRGDGRNIYLAQGSDFFEFIDNISREVVTDDNSAGIFIAPEGGGKPDEFYIARNEFHSRIFDTRTTTGSGIILFHSGDGVIESNDIHDVYTGIYYKHSCESSSDVKACPPSDGVVAVRKNRIYNIGGVGGTCAAGCGNAIWWTHHDSTIENNLIFKIANGGQQSNQLSGIGIGLWDDGAGCPDTEANQNIVRWNTVWGAATSYHIRANSTCRNRQQSNQFLNDIAFGFTSGSEPGFAIWPFGSQAPDLTQTTISFSLAFSSTVAHDAAVVGSLVNLTSLPASILGKVGNLTGQPLFTNTASMDFRLLAGPGKSAASDGSDMGAYGNGVTCVGNPNALPTPVGCDGGAPPPAWPQIRLRNVGLVLMPPLNLWTRLGAWR